MSQLVPVFHTNNEIEANTLSGLLKSFNIESLVSKESYARTMGLTVGKIGEIEILVAAEDEIAAREILESYEKGDLENGDNSSKSSSGDNDQGLNRE